MPVPAGQNSLWRVAIHGSLENQEVLNVLDFACPVGSANVETDLVIALITCYIQNILPVLTENYVLTKVTYKQIAPVLSVEYVYTPPGPNVGGGAFESEPSFVAALISKHTALGGRTHHGRLYLAGIPSDQCVGSEIDMDKAMWAALLAFCTCVASKFIIGDPPVARTFQIGVFSRKLGGETFPANPAGFTPITQLVPSVQLATMRSRKVGRGN